ncbi:DUF423 domain-containing protein [Micromonospora sp. AKA38]|uniref:DUF423 domain-containing protein n=1 Tax=Micromonospora sp. AKA38 TaxID=2733861 RepID=UPI0022C0A260|nr:DUF423 domain-containing protein [Micromonospora sp. AKA38]GHJ14014.1 hypothetical protein TPA0908_20090 [Micromonospora sp. AKA38]
MTAGVRQEPREADPARTPRRLRLPTLLALLIGGIGVGYRLALLLADAPPTNSDEATMGLAALHIARGDAFPVWFYGQAYMGTLEAYLAAPLVAVAGPSVLVLRLPTLALYALFLLLSWRLTRRLGGDRWYALLVVAVLALGADRVVKNQLIAGGGYPELNPAGAALALLTVGLCVGGPGARLPRWAAWGLVAGVLLWVDPLILPYVATLGALLLAWRRRELAGRAGAVLAGALLLGAAPMVLDSLRHGRNPLTAVLRASGSDVAAGWAERLHGGLVLGPSLAMGFCSPGHCAPWQLWWAAVFPVLLLIAACAAWRTLRRASAVPDHGPSPRPRPGDPPAHRVSAGVRLALLAGAAAVLAAYAVSDAAGRTPVESSRYLSCLAVAVPALLWPLWRAARPLVGPRHRAGPAAAGAVAVGTAAVVVLVGVLGTGGVATVDTVRAAPAVHAEADRHRALVDMLGALGVRHVRGGYWTCNRIAFATGEDVVCAVVDDRLRPGFDRLPAYRRAVAADPDAGWVAPDASPLAALLDRRLGTAPGTLDVVTVDGWRIYLPRR